MSVRSKMSYDSGRMSSKANKKVYEEMLLKEMPGNKSSHRAMHAVLESSLADGDRSKGNDSEAQRVRNHALIHYLASLANSNRNEDKFDFDFVNSLILNGADINSTDKSGQTIFHEVARSWNLDVAAFLIEHGADLNKQDTFGRSPLHVASAVDYAEMVEFLIKSGANIDIKTFGEEQTPIHYASKNDGCKSLQMLLGYGANIDSRDGKNRTPLQVAAEMNRSKTAKLLVQHGAPAGVYDEMGNSALSLLIEKLPDVAVEALDQFHSVSTINRKEYFFLNYLEGNRLNDSKSPAYSALEIAVQNQEFDVVLHPAMRRLILIKWLKFGRFGALIDLIINLIYAILWTTLAVSTPKFGVPFYTPWTTNAWRLVISVIVCLMTLEEIRKQLLGILKTRRRQKKWITWRSAALQDELAYCHPRWPQEEMYLKSEIEAIEDTAVISAGDAWRYFDWFTLFLILATITSHLTYVNLNTGLSRTIYLRIITALLLVLWLRMLKYARPFEGAGPFVVIFGHIIWDIANWGLLLSVVAIPFACAFWITFGQISSTPVKSYSSISSLLFNLFSMMVVNDHDFETLESVDPLMARLLCGSFIGIMAIICLNLLIALLSDTFSRVYGNAVANAIMQRAKTILLIENSLRPKKTRAYVEFIKLHGSPEVVDLSRDVLMNSDRDEQKASDLMKDYVKDMHTLLNERLGKQYGEGQVSDFDIIKNNMAKLQRSVHRRRNRTRKFRSHLNHLEDILISICTVHKLEIQKFIFSDSSLSSEDSDHVEPDASRRIPLSKHEDNLEESNVMKMNALQFDSNMNPTTNAGFEEDKYDFRARNIRQEIYPQQNPGFFTDSQANVERKSKRNGRGEGRRSRRTSLESQISSEGRGSSRQSPDSSSHGSERSSRRRKRDDRQRRRESRPRSEDRTSRHRSQSVQSKQSEHSNKSHTSSSSDHSSRSSSEEDKRRRRKKDRDERKSKHDWSSGREDGSSSRKEGKGGEKRGRSRSRHVDNENDSHSKRKDKTSKDKRYYQNWDNRSTKSETF